MSVVAIIAALVIEQWRPLGQGPAVQGTLGAWAAWLEQSFNGGERHHGVIAWLVAVLPPAALALALQYFFYALHPLVALLFNIAVLYLTLGFRQFSHYFTDIQLAIKAGDPERARQLLEQWRGASGVVGTRRGAVPGQHRRPPLARRGGLGVRAGAADDRSAAIAIDRRHSASTG